MRSGSQDGKTSRSAGSTTAVTPRSAASRRRPSCGSTTVMSVDAHGAQRGDAQRADGPGAEDHDAVAGRDARARDAVQRHRQRLGQRGMTGRAGPRAGAGRRRPGTGCTRRRRRRVCSPVMLLRFSHCDGLPSQAAPAGAAAWARPARRRARRPTSPVTSSPTAAIVPLHSWPATAPGVKPQPSRSWWMSDPQMPHECTRTTTWSGPGPRDRALLHRDHAGRLVDGRRHDLGKRLHRR